MKNIIEIDDHDIVNDALRDFRLYISGMYIQPDDSFFTKELEAQLTEYYRTENPVIEAAYKKMIGTSIIQTCNDSPDIPQKFKSKVAERMVSEVFQTIDASKETYNCLCSRGRYKVYAPGTIESKKERQKALNEYSVVRKAQLTQKTKTIAKRMGGRMATKFAVGGAVLETTGNATAATIVTTAAVLADVLIPKQTKEKIKEKAEYFKEIVTEKVQTALHIAETKLNETKLGQKVVEAVKTASHVVHEIKTEVKEFATEAYNGAKKLIKSGWKRLKAAFA